MVIQSMRWADYEHRGVVIHTDDGLQIGTPYGSESAYWREQEEFLAGSGIIGDIIPAPETVAVP